VGQYRPGTEAAVRLYRNGELIEQTVVLGSSPTNVAVAETPAARIERGNPLGFRVAELGEEAKQISGLEGVRIAELDDGPGREAGLLEGDVIVALDRQPVTSADRFAEVAGNLPESGFVPIRIVREGQATTLVLELSP
jgi:serine protease Do